jgi:hypothetical protein
LASIEQRGLAPEGCSKTRDRARGWLEKNKPGDSNQGLTLRTEITQRFGKPQDVAPLVEQLLKQQKADGGWSQLKDRRSDALATGQSLYTLALTGVDGRQPAIQRGQAFLTRTQRDDGSWWVPSRDKGRKGLAISHYGSRWATLGLIPTLNNAK